MQVTDTEPPGDFLAGSWRVSEIGYEWLEEASYLQELSGQFVSRWDHDVLTYRKDPKGGYQTRSYKLFEDDAIHLSFKDIDPSKAGVLLFASRFGFLGGRVWREYRDPHGPGMILGETLDDWIYQVTRYRALHELWERLDGPEPRRSAVRYIDSFTIPKEARALPSNDLEIIRTGLSGEQRDDYRFQAPTIWVRDADRSKLKRKYREFNLPVEMSWHFLRSAHLRKDGPASDLASIWSWLQWEVSLEVREGCGLEVQLLGTPRRLRISPKSLLGAIYLMLAEDMTSDIRKYRRCEICGHPFIVRNRKKTVCSVTCRSRKHRQEKD